MGLLVCVEGNSKYHFNKTFEGAFFLSTDARK